MADQDRPKGKKRKFAKKKKAVFKGKNLTLKKELTDKWAAQVYIPAEVFKEDIRASFADEKVKLEKEIKSLSKQLQKEHAYLTKINGKDFPETPERKKRLQDLKTKQEKRDGLPKEEENYLKDVTEDLFLSRRTKEPLKIANKQAEGFMTPSNNCHKRQNSKETIKRTETRSGRKMGI
ncbi:hypothetical protein V1387_18370 [Allomuricauda taeanensis]|uniref:hypothetical protein n=1 Tax=Flagellimonas taeanensis TaxID=1005926 RepID=UPI002E7BD811|nr:hypothetical protein [Allomuricauda taeanensis]MEE1964650.1 hypothetical protein [Allomuricauda taeanensis]